VNRPVPGNQEQEVQRLPGAKALARCRENLSGIGTRHDAPRGKLRMPRWEVQNSFFGLRALPETGLHHTGQRLEGSRETHRSIGPPFPCWLAVAGLSAG